MDTGGHRKKAYDHKEEIRVMYLETKQLQRLPANYQKLEERHGTDGPSHPLGKANPADTCTSDFWTPELEENKFQLSHPVCCLLQLPSETKTNGEGTEIQCFWPD